MTPPDPNAAGRGAGGGGRGGQQLTPAEIAERDNLPGFKKSTTQQQLAQRPYDPSAGSVGFKKSKKKKAKK